MFLRPCAILYLKSYITYSYKGKVLQNRSQMKEPLINFLDLKNWHKIMLFWKSNLTTLMADYKKHFKSFCRNLF